MDNLIEKHIERMKQLDSSIALGKIFDADASLIIETVIDVLVEVGNGTTDEQLHEAADYMLALRDKWFVNVTNKS